VSEMAARMLAQHDALPLSQRSAAFEALHELARQKEVGRLGFKVQGSGSRVQNSGFRV